MSEKPLRLEGKVASILNTRELSINIGLKDGVKLNMRFNVLAPKPLEVFDPDTNKLLGTLDRTKVQVKATQVFETFSVCRTFHVTVMNGILSGSSMMDLVGTREIPETLRTADSEYPEPLSEEESYVKRGDRVVQAHDDE